MKKLLIIGVAVGVGVLAVGAGLFIIKSQAVSADETFRNFLAMQASQKNLNSEEAYAGTGSILTDRGSLDTEAKKVLMFGDMTCNAKIQDSDVKLVMSVQVENTVSYFRINEVTGNIVAENGNPLDLANTFSKVKGTWYKIAEDDPAAKAQLDSGVYVFNDGVIAPSYDTQKVVDALINKKAFTYTSFSSEGENYKLDVTTNKPAYLEALKEVFPNLSNPDLILDEIFYDGSTRSFTVTVKKDGTIISEKLTDENLCNTMMETFIGTTPDGLSKDMTGVSTPKAPGSVTITPITNAKPIEEFQNDFVF